MRPGLAALALVLGCRAAAGGTADTGTSSAGTSAGSTGTTSSGGVGSTGTSTGDPGESTGGGGTSGGGSTGSERSGLAIDGEGFRFDGAPTFLLGVSYFDARSWQVADLDGLSARGWNLVRIWLDWSDDGFFDGDAFLTEDGRVALLELVAAARARDMVVDVTILDPELSVIPHDTEHRVRASQSVTLALADADNVLFDVMNEHDHGSGPIDHAEAAVIVAGITELDPGRIVTISSTGGHLVADDATVQTAMVDEELDLVGVAVVTPHLPRTPDWAAATGLRVANLRAYLHERGAIVPIYLQEEARRGHGGLDPSADEFVLAAQQARDAGAAAWIFHTDAGFELGPAGFFAALDEVETVVIEALPDAL